MIPGKQYGLDDAVAIGRRRKWLVILPFALVTLATVVATHRLPNRYQSETLILVVPQRVPEAYVRPTVTTQIQDRLQTIGQQILSRTRLERVILDFDLYREARRERVMEEVVGAMRDDISIDVVRGDSFRVSYASSDPVVAMKVTDRLASLFIEENRRERESQAQGTTQFLESQLADANRRLIDQEKRLEEFRRAYSGELPTQQGSNMQVIQNLQMQIQSVEDSNARDHERINTLQRQIADAGTQTPAVAPAPPSAVDAAGLVQGSAAEKLVAANQVLAALQRRLKPEHPDVVSLKRQISALEREAALETRDAAGQGATTPPPVSSTELARLRRVAELQADLEGAERQVARRERDVVALRKEMLVYQARVEAAPTRESQLVQLNRDYDTLRRSYESLLAKKEESRIAENLEQRRISEQFKVLDAARLPEKPVSPKRTQLNLMGAALGLMLGLVLAGGREFLDSSIRTEREVVDALDLPVLAIIPVMATAVERGRQRRIRLIATAVIVLSLMTLGTLLIWRLGLTSRMGL